MIEVIEVGAGAAHERQTAVDRFLILPMRISVKGKDKQRLWKRAEKPILLTLKKVLSDRSRLRIAITRKKKPQIASTKAGVEGWLTLQVRAGAVEVALHNSERRRSLARWIFAAPDTSEKAWARLLGRKIANRIIESMPYRGFIVAKKDDKVILNVGKADGMTAGKVYPVYSFDEDRPHFNSGRWYVGEVEILKTKRRSSMARLLSQSGEVPVYAKIDHRAKNIDTGALAYRVSEDFNLEVGQSLRSIELDVPVLDDRTRRLQYKLAFSPFFALKGSWKRFMFEYAGQSSESQFDTATFRFMDLSYAAKRWPGKRSSRFLTVGIVSEEFSAQPIVVDDDSLASVSKFSPYVGFWFHKVPVSSTKFYFSAELYLPVSVSTEVGDSSGFAMGTKAGLRTALNSSLAVLGSIGGRIGQYAFDDGRAFTEKIWSLNLMLSYDF